jgi:hypothetical protein
MTTHDEVGSESIRLADARRRLYQPRESQAADDQGERDAFLANDSEDESKGEAQLEDRRRVLGNTGASHVNISNGVVDVRDEGYEFIPSEQETRSRGVSESHRTVSSTLSSKAGIILVSPPCLQSN